MSEPQFELGSHSTDHATQVTVSADGRTLVVPSLVERLDRSGPAGPVRVRVAVRQEGDHVAVDLLATWIGDEPGDAGLRGAAEELVSP